MALPTSPSKHALATPKRHLPTRPTSIVPRIRAAPASTPIHRIPQPQTPGVRQRYIHRPKHTPRSPCPAASRPAAPALPPCAVAPPPVQPRMGNPTPPCRPHRVSEPLSGFRTRNPPQLNPSFATPFHTLGPRPPTAMTFPRPFDATPDPHAPGPISKPRPVHRFGP